MNLDGRYLAGAVAALGLALLNLLPFMPGPLTGRMNGSVLLIALGAWLGYKSGIAPLGSAARRSGAWLADLSPDTARRLDVCCVLAVIVGVLLNASFSAGNHSLRAPTVVHPVATVLATGGVLLFVFRRFAVRKRLSKGQAVTR